MVHHPGQTCAPARATSVLDPERRTAVQVADPLTREADAIHLIGSALSELPDDAARARVLRWATERFGLGSLPVQGAGEPVAPCASSDATLVVGDLHEFFDDNLPRRDSDLWTDGDTLDALPPSAETVDPPAADDAALDALEVGPVTITDIDESVSGLTVVSEPRQAGSPEPAAEFETAVHDFVAELQRLAHDWETAFAGVDKKP